MSNSMTAGKRKDYSELQCVWMQAGVVRRKYCRIQYECSACRYDRALQRIVEENLQVTLQGRRPAGKRGRIVSWRDKLKDQPVSKRPCLHHMKGRIAFRTCTNEYRCSDCDFDQYFDDQFAVHATVTPVDLVDIDGFKTPQGYYLHPGHTWVKIEAENTVRIGLDEFALRLLGPFDRIGIPPIGKCIEQGIAAIQLRRGQNNAGLLSPISGVVTAVNIRHVRGERISISDAYANGWMATVHASDLRREIRGLMIGDETSGFLRSEIDRLYEMVESVQGPLAADGGHLGDDLYGKLPGLGWQRLARRFLRN